VPPAEEVPPSLALYDALVAGKCELVLDGITDLDSSRHQALYQGIGSACIAAFQGGEDRWAQARAALSDARDQEGYLYCWDRDVLQLLETLVQHSEKLPGGTFERREGGAASSCPRITRLEPEHGPPGIPLTIHGERLFNVTQVFFNFANPERALAESDPNGRRVEVDAVPSAGSPGQSVLVWMNVSGPGVFLDPAATFTYAEETNEPTPPPTKETGDPTPSPTTERPTAATTPAVATSTP
jgi:hypothetical protein